MEKIMPSGPDTMAPQMLSAWRYHRWIYDHFINWVQGSALEIGAGHGIYTHFLTQDTNLIVATDLDLRSLKLMQERNNNPKVSFHQLDLLDKESCANLGRAFDTIICLNVLEHIEQDSEAVNNMARLLSPQGHLVLVVPAFQWLFTPLDKYAGHFRRYTQGSLSRLLVDADLEIVHQTYFNALGIVGWLIFGKAARPKSMAEPSVGNAVSFFDRVMIPVASLIDLLVFHSLGLSVLAVARKRAGNIES